MPEVEITKESYLKLINKVFDNKLEEREIALDRYRRADEQMDTPEKFVLLGKNAVSFLGLASDSSNEIALLAKEIKSIVYNDTDGTSSDNGKISQGFKSAVGSYIDTVKRNKSKRIAENSPAEKKEIGTGTTEDSADKKE